MTKNPNPVIHCNNGTTVLTLQRKNGETFTCVVDTADYHNTAAYAIPDYGPVKGIRWQAHSRRKAVYATALIKTNGKRVFIQMHSLLAGKETDHRNGNGLDNRRLNLRSNASASQQGANRPKRAGSSSSKYKGVSWVRNRWWAYITVNGKKLHLGHFKSEDDAARAYDAAARKHFGEYTTLNFPTPEDLGPTAIRNLEDIPVEPGTWIGKEDE